MVPVYSAAPHGQLLRRGDASSWSCRHRCVNEADAHAFIDPEGCVVTEFAGTVREERSWTLITLRSRGRGRFVGESAAMTYPGLCSNCGHNG